ncbi:MULTISPECIES: FUN14 domain-containing protein [Halococcus]|uniref:FUN14 family protein n=1 Tax=Halococcus salifodinae DSM 8989 TaxID=1227456 RepID=M0N5R1_9EURY|nr:MULTISPECIES: FUN14 domain-containing protein [Halococcus]EMA53267.1 hypothetical protein C450_08132 [Halococcus salifodinae DSM 8989]
MGFETALGNLGTAFGGSALAGGVTGFAAKKLAKIAVAIVGIQLAVVTYLDHQGMLDVQWAALDHALAGAQQSLQTVPPWLTALGTTLPVGAGFVGGFFLGFKRA